MRQSLEGSPTKAREAPSPHEVRLYVCLRVYTDESWEGRNTCLWTNVFIHFKVLTYIKNKNMFLLKEHIYFSSFWKLFQCKIKIIL